MATLLSPVLSVVAYCFISAEKRLICFFKCFFIFSRISHAMKPYLKQDNKDIPAPTTSQKANRNPDQSKMSIFQRGFLLKIVVKVIISSRYISFSMTFFTKILEMKGVPVH